MLVHHNIYNIYIIRHVCEINVSSSCHVNKRPFSLGLSFSISLEVKTLWIRLSWVSFLSLSLMSVYLDIVCVDLFFIHSDVLTRCYQVDEKKIRKSILDPIAAFRMKFRSTKSRWLLYKMVSVSFFPFFILLCHSKWTLFKSSNN